MVWIIEVRVMSGLLPKWVNSSYQEIFGRLKTPSAAHTKRRLSLTRETKELSAIPNAVIVTVSGSADSYPQVFCMTHPEILSVTKYNHKMRP
jgi:hypothetical protein